MVRQAFLLVAALMAAFATLAAAPALAQTSGGFPKYAFDDGTVTIEGDATTTCSSFAAFLEQGYFESGDTLSAQAQAVLKQCEEAGLLASADSVSSGSVSASSSASAPALPETGGPAIPAAASALPLALLVVGGLFALRLARR